MLEGLGKAGRAGGARGELEERGLGKPGGVGELGLEEPWGAWEAFAGVH